MAEHRRVDLGNDPFLSHTQQRELHAKRKDLNTDSKYQHAHMTRNVRKRSWLQDCCEGAALVLSPLLVYILIACLFFYVHYTLPLLTWLTVLSCFLCSGALVAMALYANKDLGWHFVMGVSCSVACIFAIWIGIVGYQWYMREFWWMEIGRHYTDLNATTIAQSRNDASWLHFSNGSHVDTMKAVGYRDGVVFCVAPVLNANQATRVEYWAIGKDCCQKRSGFTCGDVGVPGAQSAIAMLGQDFVDRFSYQRAVRQAEATHKLASAEGALLVRWVSDPKSIRDGLLWSGLIMLALGAVVEIVIAIILAFAMPRPHHDHQGQMQFLKGSDVHGTKAYGTKGSLYHAEPHGHPLY